MWPGWSATLAVLRLGDAGAAVGSVAPGTALPLPPRPVVDDVAGAYTPGCTLAAGRDDAERWHFETEGFPSNSQDRAFGLVPCYDVAVGTALSGSSRKTIARVDRTAAVDTSASGFISQVVSEAPGANNGWRQVASPDGARFYTASVALLDAGYRYISDVGATDATGSFVSVPAFGSRVAGARDARGVALYGGRLWAAAGPADAGWNTLWQIGGAAAPTAPTTAYTKLAGLPAAGLGSVWTFTFGNSTNAVWAAVERSYAPRGVAQLWQRAASTRPYALALVVTFDPTAPLYVLTSRTEFRRTVLYGTSLGGLFRYDTAGVATGVRSATRLLSADAGTQYRGVMFAGAPVTTPSSSGTPSASVSPSGTPSRSRSRVSRSRSRSRTPSKTRARKAHKQ